MAFEGINPYEVYEGIRFSETGKQIERVLRALCFLLDGWSRFGGADQGESGGSRKGRYGNPDRGEMLLIEFDKLANIVCRLWEGMFQLTGLPHLEAGGDPGEDELDSMVRFRPPFQELPGMHGPGEARIEETTGKAAYLTGIIEKLVDDEEFPYFSFQPYESTVSGGGKAKGQRSDPRRKVDDPHTWVVRPGIAVGDDGEFWDGFTEKEVRFLRTLAMALKHLGPTEIRALGIHKDGGSTADEVKRELKWALREKKKILLALNSLHVVLDDARKFQTLAQEAVRKALENTEDYGSAYTTMLREIDDAELKNVFRECQKSPEVVWGHRDLPELGEKGAHTLALANCIYGIAYFGENPEERSSAHTNEAKHALHCWEEGLAAAEKCMIRGLPESHREVFGGDTSEIRPAVANRLKELLAES